MAFNQKDNLNMKLPSKLFRLLDPKDRWKFPVILGFSLITGLLQSASVASFLPFMNLLLNVNSIQSNAILNRLFQLGRFTSTRQFAVALGIGVTFLIIISNVSAIITSWFKNKFILFTAHRLSKRILNSYMNEPYEFILYKNTSELGKNILHEVFELTNGLLNGILDLIINIIMIVFVIAMLMVVNVKVTFYIITFFIIVYGFLMFFSKSKLKTTGERAMRAHMDKFKFTHEALGSFKISKTLGIENYLIFRVEKASLKHTKYRLFAKTLQEVPKYIIDAIIFSSLSIAIVYFIVQNKIIENIIPMISVYTIAGYRIMPEIAKIFASFSSITHNRPVLDKLYSEMFETFETHINPDLQNHDGQQASPIQSFQKIIELDGISFHYMNTDPIINNISLSIDFGTVVGFAGTTGSGKTTLIDILMGLLIPQSGRLLVDKQIISPENVRSWQRLIGYVPQEIYLIDDTIRANIAFGIPEHEINDEKVKQVARIAAIADYIENELPDQYLSQIGERGVRLSGGQRQRIGLARALYRDPEVLVLDEATSALDGATEESVVKSIHTISNVKTIVIIAHRLNTLKSCDQIYLLEHGQVIDHGTYEQLFETSTYFRKMSKLEH